MRAYIAAICAATRNTPLLSLGASTRAAIALIHAAQANAMLCGRDYIIPEDVQHLSPSVLCHRLSLSAEARMRGYTNEQAFAEVLSAVRIPVIEAGAMPDAIARLREKGITCLAVALYKSQPLSAAQASYPGGVCVVIGSEGQGLTDATIAACTSTVRIPMTDRVESLNAGIAGSILLWHFREESL